MVESSYPSQQQDKFVLRLPDGMRDRIKAAAEANNRSMNAEIVATLEREYPESDILIDALADALRKAEDAFHDAASEGRKEDLPKLKFVRDGLRGLLQHKAGLMDLDFFPTFHEDVPTWHEGDDAGNGPRSAGEGGPAVAGDTAPPKKTGRSQSPRPRVKKVRTK